MKNYLPRLLLLCGLQAAVFFVYGCGDGSGNRKEVKGTVKLHGALLDNGSIEFIPLATSGDGATKSGAMITKGAYVIPKALGLVPGKYKVIISAGDGKTPAANPDEPPGPTGANIISVDLIPPEYNVDSKQEVEVTAKGPNVFDYNIP